MTAEQLTRLMNWVTDFVKYEIEYTASGNEDRERFVIHSRRKLYESFGFADGPDHEPVEEAGEDGAIREALISLGWTPPGGREE